MGARLLGGLRAHLATPLTVPESRAILRRRLENRETDFLALARQAIFANRRSPYRALLRLAGCDYGDLERLVRREGRGGRLARSAPPGRLLDGRRVQGEAPGRSWRDDAGRRAPAAPEPAGDTALLGD
jgi:hypothetical protein